MRKHNTQFMLGAIIPFLFMQCRNMESNSYVECSDEAIKDSLTDESYQTVDVRLMRRFEGEEFPESVRQLFSNYYSAIAQGQGTINFYDEQTLKFMRHPGIFQNLRQFHRPGFFKKDKPMIVAVYPQGSDTIVKLNFVRVDSNGVGTNMATINFGVTEQEGYLHLTNMVLINSRDWVSNESGNITYVYPPSHSFSERTAARMEAFNQRMAALCEIGPVQFRYFITDSDIAVSQLWGFDYAYDMYNMDISGGAVDIYNKIIYSGNGTEYYPHEAVHLYVSEWLGGGWRKAHIWFDEGFATYLGGSRGKSLEWHLEVLKAYLNSEPKPDLSKMFELKMKIGISTNLDYVIGGLICKLAYEKGGMPAIKELLTAGETDEEFYLAVEKVLGVPKEDFGDFIYREITTDCDLDTISRERTAN